MKLSFARRPTLPALGQRSPALEVRTLDGARWTLADSAPRVFTLVVFYHGHHCPVCRTYVGELERKHDAFAGRGVEVIAISGDSADRAERSRAEWMLGRLRVGYGLTQRQMQSWELSLSHGTQPDEPAVFNDPGVFLVRPDRVLYYAALTSLPVGRPRFDDLLEGIDWVIAREAPRPEAVPSPGPVPAQWRALLRLLGALEAAGIEYQMSGGLAGNVHGSSWPLHDIDLDVPAARIAEVAALFAGEVRDGPARFADDEFDLTLLRLDLDGVPVDVSAAEDAWLFARAGARVPLRIDLARAERGEFGAISLRVAPLDDLIAYKRLLGRERDVADLLRLRDGQPGTRR